MDAPPVTAVSHTSWPAPAPRRAQVHDPAVTYLAGIADAQQCYLRAVGDLGAHLAAGPGDLAALAAGHARLAREFLDGQRAILRRRADTNVEVAVIVGRPSLPPPTTASRVTGHAPTAPVRAAGAQPADTELADMVDRAFEPPTASAERELRALLDGWWIRECDEGEELLADARARAYAVTRLGTLQPELAESPPADLPDELAGPLDGVEALDELLDTLLRVLDGTPPGSPVAPEATAPFALRPPAETRDAEQFDRFWKGGPAGQSRGAVGNWVLVQVLLPMVSLISVLALVLAVVG